MKIAICYYGILRSLPITYCSHIDNIFNILKTNNIEFDTYVHTWTGKLTEYCWNNKKDFINDPTIAKLLNPKILLIDDQDIFLDKLNFAEYFYQDVYDLGGNTHDAEWAPYMVRNQIFGFESLKRSVNLALESREIYNAILILRPDMLINRPIDINTINGIPYNSIVIPNYDHGEGCNSAMAYCSIDCVKIYSDMVNLMPEFRKNHGRIVGEKYVKYILETSGCTIYANNFVDYTLLRPSGVPAKIEG